MSKKLITYEQYLSLVGLLTLANEHNKRMIDIEQASAEIVGEEEDCGYYGHVSDEIWGRDSSPVERVKNLLNNLDISVEKGTKKIVKQSKKK